MDRKDKKDKVYSPPEIKEYDVKELLEGWDNKLFGKLTMVCCSAQPDPRQP